MWQSVHLSFRCHVHYFCFRKNIPFLIFYYGHYTMVMQRKRISFQHYVYDPWSWKIFPTLLCYCCNNYYFTFIWFHQKYNNCYYAVIIAKNMHFHFSITITIIILPWHWSLLLIATKSIMLRLWQKYFFL